MTCRLAWERQERMWRGARGLDIMAPRDTSTPFTAIQHAPTAGGDRSNAIWEDARWNDTDVELYVI